MRKTCSSAPLAGSPAPWRSLATRLPRPALRHPAESQGKAEVPGKAVTAGGVAPLPPCPPLLLSLLPSLHPAAQAFNSALLFPLFSPLLHYSAFLLWRCFGLLFFTSRLTTLLVEDENSKPCGMAV